MRRFLAVLAVTVVGLSGPPVGARSATAPRDVRATTRVVSTTPLAPLAPVTRIMLVGDSITHGAPGDFTWRYRLARALTIGRARVDMVGPRDDLFPDSHAYADPGFDQDHGAFWGQLLSVEITQILADATAHRPDVIGLLIGVNDITHEHSTTQIEADLNTFIDLARQAVPSVAIVIGTVMPTNGVADPVAIDAYNARIPVVAATRTTPESPILVVDTHAAIDPVADLYDGVHPNPVGEMKIAAVFYPAVKSVLRKPA